MSKEEEVKEEEKANFMDNNYWRAPIMYENLEDLLKDHI